MILILSNYIKTNLSYMATLAALAAFVEKGGNILDLPWFSMTKAAKKYRENK